MSDRARVLSSSSRPVARRRFATKLRTRPPAQLPPQARTVIPGSPYRRRILTSVAPAPLPPPVPVPYASDINPAYPVYGTPTTQSVRDNFQAAKDEIEALQNGKLDLSGGTLSGPLTLSADPATTMQAATRQYVDARTPIISDAPNDGNYWYGRHTAAWSIVPGYQTYGSVALNLNTITPAAFQGLLNATNQSGSGVNWPTDNPDQTALILHGFNSNPGWKSQLMMGGRQGTKRPMPALWYRSNDDAFGAGAWTPWQRLIGESGGTFTGQATFNAYTLMNAGLSFGSVVDTSPDSVGAHISLYGGNQYGFGITSGRLNYVAPTGSAHAFRVGGNEIAHVDGGGLTVNTTVTIGASGNNLRITPNDGARAGTVSFVSGAPTANNNLPFQFIGPVAIGNVQIGGTTPGQQTIIVPAGQDGASLSLANLALNSWNGIGFAPTVASSPVPAGLNSIIMGVRAGNLVMMGNVQAWNTTNNFANQLGLLGFRRNGSDQMVYIDGNANYAALNATTPIATGGSGVNVNDRFYDAYNNTYTATAVTAGAVTTIRMDSTSARLAAPPANPVTLTAAPGFSGTGVTVNLTWTAPTRLLIQAAASATLGLQGGGGITLLNATTANSLVTFQNGASFGNTLAASPTDLSHHIALWSTGSGYGLSVTSNRLNLVAGSGASVNMVNASGDLAAFDASGLAMRAGDVTLLRDPTALMHAATKQYVDAHSGSSAGVSSFNGRTGAVSLTTADVTTVADATYVNVAGDTMTGNLSAPGVYGSYLNSSGNIDAGNAIQSNNGRIIAYRPDGSPATLTSYVPGFAVAFFCDSSGNMIWNNANADGSASGANARMWLGWPGNDLHIGAVYTTGDINCSGNQQIHGSLGILFPGQSAWIRLWWDGNNLGVSIDGSNYNRALAWASLVSDLEDEVQKLAARIATLEARA